MLTSVRILQLYAQHAVIPDRDAAGIALINVARAIEAEATTELRVENDAHRQEANALANYVSALHDALTVIANRECADEDECAGVAMRCLRQIDAALAGEKPC